MVGISKKNIFAVLYVTIAECNNNFFLHWQDLWVAKKCIDLPLHAFP